MKNQFSLNIKTPCSENFNSFASTPNGGFCGSCKHDVIDFTKMSDEQIILHFKNQSNANTCGRFKSTQLDSAVLQHKKVSFWTGIGLACLSLFSYHSAQSQNVPITAAFPDKNISQIETSQHLKNIVVKGRVIDDQLPLPGVNVVLEGTTIGTQTNFDGEFKFPQLLKKGDVLLFSYIGFDTQKVIIENSESASNIELNVNMTSCEIVLMGKVAVKQIYNSKKH